MILQNHSNMLNICCSIIIGAQLSIIVGADYYQCWKRSSCLVFLWKLVHLFRILYKRTAFIWNINIL